MDNNTQIVFRLVVITTEQFAIIEESFNKEVDIKIQLDFRFDADEKQKLVAVFNKFTFSSNEKQFLLIEAGCHFAISEDSWNEMLDQRLKKLTVSKELLQHLTMITIGTSRGILHAKTENTPFNFFNIPLINLEELIKDDKTLDLKVE